MSIRDIIFGRAAERKDEEERPVKLVQESTNVWRVVYADSGEREG